MGQKLDKRSEKDEESFENSDWSEQTGETEQTHTREQGESRDQDNRRFGASTGPNVRDPATGDAGELTLTPARTDPQIGQPIVPLDQREHTLSTRGEWVGGDREIRSGAATTEESKTVLSPKETRQTPNNKRVSESKAVVYTGITAMEEQENGKKAELGQRKLDPDAQTRSLIASCDPNTEEDFVVLEEGETLMSSEGENNIMFGNKMEADNLQSCMKRRVEEDASASYSGDNLPQSSRNAPQEKANEKASRRKSDTLLVATDSVAAHVKSLPTDCFQREMGRHLAEVTGNRCWLKGVSYVGAADTETTGKAESEQNGNEHSKEQVSTAFDKERLLSQNNSGSVGRLRKNAEDMVDEAVQLILQEESGGKRKMKSNWEPCSEKVDYCLRVSEIQDKESHNLGFIAEKTQVGTDQSDQSTFVGVVSKRAKAGTLCLSTKKQDSQVFSKAANTYPQKPPSSETQLPQDNPSFSLELSSLIPCPPPLGNEGSDGKRQIASLKRESELVCFSAVITPPPVTHWLPKRDTSAAIQLSTSMVNSQMEPDDTPAPCDLKDALVPKEKPKVKGPPPPVPKKPKNPFIKLKTTQLMSADVQRRGKDHPRSEERVKRRHTFHFNKDTPLITNQDMCLLWDERGTYTVPTHKRPLSVDLSPWAHGSLGRMDDQYGDMIDFDYCARMEKMSPEEELQNLDMMQRRVFLERRSRFKSSPPPVANKPPNPFASTEALHIPEVIPDNEIQRPKPACSGKGEIYPERQSDRVRAQVSNHGNYGNRKEITDSSGYRDAESGSEVGSYKPVAEIVKETNQMQRHQGRAKPEGAKAQVRVPEQSPSVKVSQMKNAFDVPKKSKERPPEVQSSPKKGKDFVFFNDPNVYQRMQTHALF